jgi:2-keto-4-pentenoate hydratase/2-oxohepta-3-ene-1,7-dioic acid hydratase in catechol pathway
MKFVSFRTERGTSYGVAIDRGVFDLGARNPILPNLKSYLHAVSLGLAKRQLSVEMVDYANGEFRYDPVIPNPKKIFCVDRNDEERREETGRPKSAYPSIVIRFADTLLAHEAPILLPAVSNALDYEGALAVVIGKAGFRVPESAAPDLVAGYACFNDATLRDWQCHSHQFTPGKNFPATGSFGPHLVTPDEVGALRSLRIEARLAGVVMQSATLGDLMFSVPRVISYISGFTPLSPGDVIAIGTPSGIGSKRDAQHYMKTGDLVEISIEGVGTLCNAIVPEPVQG